MKPGRWRRAKAAVVAEAVVRVVAVGVVDDAKVAAAAAVVVAAAAATAIAGKNCKSILLPGTLQSPRNHSPNRLAIASASFGTTTGLFPNVGLILVPAVVSNSPV